MALSNEENDSVKPSVGRIVHFVRNNGEHRAALIVRDWEEPSGSVNLYVFLDGGNDRRERGEATFGIHGIEWATSVNFDDATKKPYTWHWPERVESSDGAQ